MRPNTHTPLANNTFRDAARFCSARRCPRPWPPEGQCSGPTMKTPTGSTLWRCLACSRPAIQYGSRVCLLARGSRRGWCSNQIWPPGVVSLSMCVPSSCSRYKHPCLLPFARPLLSCLPLGLRLLPRRCALLLSIDRRQRAPLGCARPAATCPSCLTSPPTHAASPLRVTCMCAGRAHTQILHPYFTRTLPPGSILP